MRTWRRTKTSWTSNQVAAAYCLIKTPMGLEAVEGRWIGALWDFCRENSRLPNRYEADELRARSLEIQNSLPASALSAVRAKADRLAKVVMEQAL